MPRRILVEQFRTSELSYLAESGINEQGKHYIGRLEGPAADLINPTRNGRKYGLKLWRNVENSDDFKEGMATLTIFGEADHPEDRLETSIKEIAVCLRKFEIREAEGIVWCSFDILDTPNGRIVKELLDYGSKLGVSSRGSGEEIVVNGENEIDPDTYLFICFDIVIMPAVAKARPKVVESVDFEKTTKLVESIKSEIMKASTAQELNSIKSIIESAKLPDTDSLCESINKQLSKLGNGEDISSKLVADLEESSLKISELENSNKVLKEQISADNIRIKKLENLNAKYKSNSLNMRKLIKEARQESSSFQDNLYECSQQYSEVIDNLSDYKEQNEALLNRINEVKDLNKSLESSNSVLTEENKKLKSKLSTRLTESTAMKSTQDTILKENKKLKDRVTRNEGIIESYRINEDKLNAKVSSLQESYSKALKEKSSIVKKYISSCAIHEGFNVSDIMKELPKKFSISDVDRVVESLKDNRHRLNKVPVSLNSNIIDIITESKSVNDEEFSQTVNMISSVAHKNKL